MTPERLEQIRKNDVASGRNMGGELVYELFQEEQDRRDLLQEVDRLMAAIRKHRDERGDDRCWMDDEELYKTLPEGFTPPVRDSKVELINCEKYIACRHNPGTRYVSPQRQIEELQARLKIYEDWKKSIEDSGDTDGWAAALALREENARLKESK